MDYNPKKNVFFRNYFSFALQLSGMEWQRDGEGRSLTFLALHTNGAAVLQDDLSAEAEADAGARGLGSEEGDEGMGEDVGRHTAAVVADADFAISIGRYLYLCGSTLVGVFDEVDEHLFQLGAVGRQLSLALGLYLRVEPCNMLKEFSHGEGGLLRCFDARQQSVTLYKVEQRVAAAVNDGEGLDPLLTSLRRGGT